MSTGTVRRPSPAVIVSVALLLLALGCLAFVLAQRAAYAEASPWDERKLYLSPDSAAATAAAAADSPDEKRAFEKIADTPAAVWLEPERHGAEKVGDYVHGIVRAAARESALPVFVVYGIPNRDCGNQSRGGLPPAEYRDWLSEIADALGDTGSVVILEPDSLALASECGNLDERVTQVSSAIDVVAASGATVYLDGGHSDWLSAQSMAQILERAGVDRVRGFATNVSNYNSTADEIAYADRLSALIGDAHYVVDTSRNGNGSNGQWCNPGGRALGDPPAIVTDESRLDARLWIKNPGESDGTCRGGPPAGVWWDEGALNLSSGR